MEKEKNDASLRDEVETARDLFLKGRRAWLRIIGRRKSIQIASGIVLVGGVLLTNICYKMGWTEVANFLFWWPWLYYILSVLVIWYAITKRLQGYKKAAAYLNMVWPPKSGAQWKASDMPGVLKIAEL